MQKPLAIFDIDGTIFRSSLVIELVDALIRADAFPQSAQQGFADEYRKWVDREGDYERYIQAVVTVFKTHIKGIHYGTFADIAESVVAEHQKRVYRYTRGLVQHLRNEGYFLLAISQSPKTVLDKFAGQYGFDKVYGRVYELGPGDRFTGVIIDEHLIENKANIVRRAVEREPVTLDGSIGVGDTESDISFLELVTHPVCFNPNSVLYRHANRLAWPIVVERKDVIYHIRDGAPQIDA